MQKPKNLLTFIKTFLNRKLYFLCSGSPLHYLDTIVGFLNRYPFLLLCYAAGPNLISMYHCYPELYHFLDKPLTTGHKLNIRITFRRCQRLIYVQYTYSIQGGSDMHPKIDRRAVWDLNNIWELCLLGFLK